MMEMPPKLPKPSAWIYGELAPGKALTFARPQMARTAGPDGVTPIYTAADLQEWGESCARMAREEAAKVWEADALRYRWLREESGVVASFIGIGLSTGAKHPKDMRQLDERIDQLRKG